MSDRKITKKAFAGMIDLVDLRVTATRDDILALVDDACRLQVHSIGSPYCFHPLVVQQLKQRGEYGRIDVLGGAGFADGNWPTEVKLASIARCLEVGCTEIDLTGNVCYVKSGMWEEYEKEVSVVRTLTRGFPLKVILHTPLLTEEEIVKCCEILLRHNVDYVKTDTGRSPTPTTLRHVELIRQTVKDKAKIKASGGIRDVETIIKMIDMGVSRFGISRSSALKIINNLPD